MASSGYPLSQAADISIFKAHLVPVGEDQIPISNWRAKSRRFNDIYQPVLVEPEALVGSTPPGGSGWQEQDEQKPNNAVYLSDPPEVVHEKVRNGLPTRPVFAKPIRGTLRFARFMNTTAFLMPGSLRL